MDMITCPKCRVRVVAMADGNCPSCRQLIPETAGSSSGDHPEPLAAAVAVQRRPTSISVISWILIVLGGLGLITTTMMLGNPAVQEVMEKSPTPVPLQLAMSYIGLCVLLASGAAMLNGHNWGRWLYIGWTAFALGIGLATAPSKTILLPSALFFAVVAFFLFRPNASSYFTDGGAGGRTSV